MRALGLHHEYRSVSEDNYVGQSLTLRVIEAVRFLGRSLTDCLQGRSVDTVKEEEMGSLNLISVMRRQALVKGPAGLIHVWECGASVTGLLIPSLG